LQTLSFSCLFLLWFCYRFWFLTMDSASGVSCCLHGAAFSPLVFLSALSLDSTWVSGSAFFCVLVLYTIVSTAACLPACLPASSRFGFLPACACGSGTSWIYCRSALLVSAVRALRVCTMPRRLDAFCVLPFWIAFRLLAVSACAGLRVPGHAPRLPLPFTLRLRHMDRTGLHLKLCRSYACRTCGTAWFSGCTRSSQLPFTCLPHLGSATARFWVTACAPACCVRFTCRACLLRSAWILLPYLLLPGFCSPAVLPPLRRFRFWLDSASCHYACTVC